MILRILCLSSLLSVPNFVFPICIPRFPVTSQDNLDGKAVEILGYSLEVKKEKGKRSEILEI